MSATQEELMTETEAAQHLGFTPERLRELVSLGLLRSVFVPGPQGNSMMFYTGEIVRFKERHIESENRTDAEKNPDVIGK